jgi:hypothetical protein
MDNKQELTQIGGASYGTSGIVQAMLNMIKTRKLKQVDTLFVNILTLLRNCYDKDLNYKQIIEQLNVDMQVLITFFSEYVNHLREQDLPSMIMYLPSYHHFPTIHLRPESPSSKLLTNVFKKFIQQVYPQERYDYTHNNLRIHVIHAGMKSLPHVDIFNLLPKLLADCKKKAFRDYWMISHVPLDYHLIDRLHGRCWLIDSHTGNFWNNKTLGIKVFRNTSIPFNSVTHLLLGDKILVKCLLNRRDKANALKIATSDNWLTKTKQQIAKRASVWMPETVLTTLKL